MTSSYIIIENKEGELSVKYDFKESKPNLKFDFVT